jgi:hypothetical protein
MTILPRLMSSMASSMDASGIRVLIYHLGGGGQPLSSPPLVTDRGANWLFRGNAQAIVLKIAVTQGFKPHLARFVEFWNKMLLLAVKTLTERKV